MWIRGNILLSRQMNITELGKRFPEGETEINEQEVVINTRNIPFFAEHKLHLKPNKNNMLKCPSHYDKSPSLKVYTDTHTFNSFGCGKAGEQIEWLYSKQ